MGRAAAAFVCTLLVGCPAGWSASCRCLPCRAYNRPAFLPIAPCPALQDETELAAFTPAFLWLLRDFYLRLEEDGRQVNGAAAVPPSVKGGRMLLSMAS